MDNTQIELEINNILYEVDTLCNELSTLTPVSHYGNSVIRFSGGIIGGIQDYFEDKKLYKMINTQIIQNKSFYDLGFYIIDKTEELVNLQKQMICSEDYPMEKIAATGELIIEHMYKMYVTWHDYSPSMTTAPIKSVKGSTCEFGPSVEFTIKKIFSTMIPSDRFGQIKPKEKSGCFSILALFFIPTASILCYVAHEITSFFV